MVDLNCPDKERGSSSADLTVDRSSRYEIPGGWICQSFVFRLDPSPNQRQMFSRQFGGRRYAYNWALRTIKTELDRSLDTGDSNSQIAPSFYSIRKRWNAAKTEECVDSQTGAPWWPEISKDAFADGIKGAVEGYWNWCNSKTGRRDGQTMGFPRFKKKGRDPDRFTISAGTKRLDPDRRHVVLARIGKVRTCENTRKLERLVASGRARILAVTIRQRGSKTYASFRVLISRPQSNLNRSLSVVGVDVGVKTFATIATSDGTILERVNNPRPLKYELSELRRLNRQKSRRKQGSIRHTITAKKIADLNTKIANIRCHHIHVLTTRLAKTHGTVVIEGLNVADMYQDEKGLNARGFRRGLADSAFGEFRRQLRYKCEWYGSNLIEADRWFASTKTCHLCHSVHEVGGATSWICGGCGAPHSRDENAAINLARWPEEVGESDLGGVAALVKRRAMHKTGYRSAAGVDTRSA